MSEEVDEFDPTDYVDPEPRLPRGYLALDVYNICKAFSEGEITLDEAVFMTPHIIAKIIMENNPGKTNKPSTGAVAAVLKRWDEWDFCICRRNPYAFVDFSEHGKEVGLVGITAERKELKRKNYARTSLRGT